MQSNVKRNVFIVQLNKKHILTDTLVFLGFLLEFLFYGETLGQIGYMLVLAAGALCFVQYQPIKIKHSVFIAAYFLLTLYFQARLMLGDSIAPIASAAYISTMLKCLIYMLFAYQYLYQRTFQEISNLFTVLGLSVSIYLLLINRTLSGTRFAGSSLNANSVGMLCALAIVCICYRILSKDHCNLPVQIAAITVLSMVVILSGSRKALLLMIAPIAVYYVFRKNKKIFFRILLVLGITVLTVLLLINIPYLYDSVGYRLESLASWVLTGETTEGSINSRVKYINIGLEFFLQKPWTGFGAAAFSSLPGTYNTYSHNNFIELMVSGGIPAVILFYFPFAVLLHRMQQVKRNDNTFVFLSILLLCQLVLHMGLVTYYTRRELFVYLFLFAVTAKKMDDIKKVEAQK